MSNYLCPQHCVARHPKCHVDCPQHAKFIEENNKRKKARHMDQAISIYQVDQKNKLLRDKRNHRPKPKIGSPTNRKGDSSK